MKQIDRQTDEQTPGENDNDKVDCTGQWRRPGISWKGQGHFHFFIGHFHWEELKGESYEEAQGPRPGPNFMALLTAEFCAYDHVPPMTSKLQISALPL